MYKIIVDSCGEFTEDLKADSHFQNIPLELEVDGVRIVDDANFNQADFLRRVKESLTGPKSSCPSPEAFMESYKCEADHVYVVTLSAELSGSYNSAVLAKNLYEESYGEKKIHVFNSKSASIGETLIALKIKECEDEGMDFEEVISSVDEYIEGMHTFFVLETLETLRKNGRLSNLKAFVAGALNIKPIMGSTAEGAIQQLGQARGMVKALKQMVKEAHMATKEMEGKVLAIAHCNAPEKAAMVKAELEKNFKFKKIIILDTAGISSMYASDGGVILAL